MAEGQFKEGIAGGRLSPAEYADNFSDLHPPLDHHEALVESDRCYFCYDAPCMQACPTSIDIPLFIREIATGNPLGSAKTIFDQNILGGMCARVCPTETLCEEVCVREVAEGKPVQIGRLQRYATDIAMGEGKQFYKRAASTGRKIAVVGAGPAGLAAAHRLARYGHDVTILEARPKSGGLNEFGIAAYKSTDNFAQAEVDYVTSIGGIAIENGRALGRDFHLSDLTATYDAVFLGLGLGGVNALRAAGEAAEGVENAVEFIATLRQARGSGGAAGRPPRRGDRRRHDGDRRRRAVEAARRRRGDDLLPARPGAHERVGVRAGSGDRQRRRHPPLAAAEAGDLRWRQGHRHRDGIHGDAGRQARRHRRDDRAAGRPGVQGDRPEL